MGVLKDKFASVALPMATEIKEMVKEYGDLELGSVTLSQLYGGQKSIKALVTETSLLDPEEGIRIRGYSLPELHDKLPKYKPSRRGEDMCGRLSR